MSEINDFYNEIKNLNTKNELPKEFKTIIRKQILTIFPNLKNEDIEILSNLTIYIVNTLKIKFLNQEKIEDVIRQFTQNNFRDIKKVTLLLIPFIDDKDDNEKSKKVKDLNMILYNIMGSKEISNTILEKEISDTLKQEFLISNFAIGLLNDNKGSQLVLKNDKDRLIDKIIYNNFIGLLETLKIVTGKLYVNWFNISPINENNYEEQEIFKRTQELSSFFKDFSKYNNHSEYIKFEQNYGGLWVGDLYNVFRKGYYSNVKKDKWLIYNKNKKYYIQILDNLLNLDNHLDDKYKTYIDLPLDDKIDFEQKFENTVLESKTNSTVYDMLKNILIFMVNNYSNIPLINLKNQDTPTIDKFRLFEDLLSQNDAEDEDGEFFGKENKNKIKNITKEDVYLAIKIFKLDDIWNYLKEAIVRFKSTIYFTFLNKNNKIDQDFFYFKFNKDDTEEINLKNLYNIGKLLSHDYLLSENPIFQENYISLNEKSKIVFLEKFFMGTNWIKISKNLRIEEIQTPENTRLLNIVNIWNKYKINFVFLYLIRKGILSKFKSDFDITDKNSLPRGYVAGNKRIEKLMEQKFKNNKEWNDSYYYLTNKKYSDLDSIRIDDPILKIKNFSYFDLVSKEHKWFKFYAMDWLTQISFFHTYINHQILYVTGATGQGKSTQVPKLLMYAMKMFDYKENGKIVCTQPRVPPTVNNAERISEELGVPIIQPSKTSKEKIKTDNYFVQYKHSKDSHVDSLNNNLSLKIETDGTLFSELKQNILMKEFDQFDRRRNDSTSNMKLKNKYDIIIVDEAHEHNKYMDLILTLSRNTCYYNNSIRLIIISATMDDDEPIYRSYFKINNDNLTFPLKEPLKFNPILANNKSIFPQTIFMDRRFHISPPGESTQYKISEKYLDLPENNSSSEKNAKVAQIESYKVVIEICNKTSTGEILLFSTGQAEILDAVEYLNKNLPGGNVALPYFGSMDAKYKNVIE